MNFLTINTLLNVTSIGYVNTNNYDDAYHLLVNSDEKQVEKIIPHINQLFASYKCSLNSIDRIVVTNGIGSFTSTRIAIAITKIISLVNNIKVNTVNTHEILFYHSLEQGKIKLNDNIAKIVIIPLNISSDKYYVQVFDSISKQAKKYNKIKLITLDKLIELISCIGDYMIITNTNNPINNYKVIANKFVISDFNNVHVTMSKIALNKDVVTLDKLKPLYVKLLLFRTIEGNLKEE